MAARSRSKAWVLIPFWLAQASALYVLPAVVVHDDPTRFFPDPAHVAETLAESDYIFLAFIIALGVTLTQALIVMPVAPAKIDRHARPSWARCALAGSALGIIAAGAIYSVVGALGATHVWDPPHALVDPLAPPFSALALTLALIASILIRRSCVRGIPIMLSLVMLGLIAALICTGAALALAEAIEQLTTFEFSTAGWAVMSGCAVVGPWALGTLLLRAYLRAGARLRTPEWALTRVSRWLFAGSVVELVATIPLDVMVRRRSSCYCAEGTFWSLLLAATAGFAALGPMIFLLPIARRRERAFQGLCPSCGYDRRSLAHDTPCPECGQSRLG